MRAALIALIVLATVGFVIGTSTERHNAHNESAAQLKAERSASGSGTETTATTTSESGGETPAEHAAEGGEEGEPSENTSTSAGTGGETPAEHAAEGGTRSGEPHKELRPFGIDIEALPFVALAALASLALAALGWARPGLVPGLVAIAVAMFVFGVLDVREAFHQSDEHQTGLVILAVGIAALHFGAAGCAAAMAARSSGADAAPAGTIPA